MNKTDGNDCTVRWNDWMKINSVSDDLNLWLETIYAVDVHLLTNLSLDMLYAISDTEKKINNSNNTWTQCWCIMSSAMRVEH